MMSINYTSCHELYRYVMTKCAAHKFGIQKKEEKYEIHTMLWTTNRLLQYVCNNH